MCILIQINTYMFVYTHEYRSVCGYLMMYMYIYIYIYVFIYMCLYIFTYCTQTILFGDPGRLAKSRGSPAGLGAAGPLRVAGAARGDAEAPGRRTYSRVYRESPRFPLKGSFKEDRGMGTCMDMDVDSDIIAVSESVEEGGILSRSTSIAIQGLSGPVRVYQGLSLALLGMQDEGPGQPNKAKWSLALLVSS